MTKSTRLMLFLPAFMLWMGSLWVAYWSGFGAGLFTVNNSVRANESSMVLKDIHTLVRLNGGGIDETRNELASSIKLELQELELQEQFDNAQLKGGPFWWVNLILDSVYKTPLAFSSLEQAEEFTHIPSASEIRVKYRDELESK